MSENALRRTDEIRKTSRLGSKANTDGSSRGQGKFGPATQGRGKKRKSRPRESLDATAFPERFFGPGRGKQVQFALREYRFLGMTATDPSTA